MDPFPLYRWRRIGPSELLYNVEQKDLIELERQLTLELDASGADVSRDSPLAYHSTTSCVFGEAGKGSRGLDSMPACC
jgi:hypothetical protein